MATVDELRTQLDTLEKQISSMKQMAAAGVPGMNAQVTMLQNMYNATKAQYTQAVQAQQAAYTAQIITPAPRATVAPMGDEVVNNSSSAFNSSGKAGRGLGGGASVGGGLTSSQPPASTKTINEAMDFVNYWASVNYNAPELKTDQRHISNLRTALRQEGYPASIVEEAVSNFVGTSGSAPSAFTMSRNDALSALGQGANVGQGTRTSTADTTPADTPAGGAGGTTGTTGATEDFGSKIVTIPGVGRGYWYYDAYGEPQFMLLADEDGSSGSSSYQDTKEYWDRYFAMQESENQIGNTDNAAQLAWQQEQWAQQLAWYQEQAALEAKQEADRLAAERQSYLSDLAANPRQWIKYNIETTDQAGTTPGWLSQLFEGKVAEGASLDDAKALGRFPILSKNWYDWLTPSEKEMMSGYISWAGTDPNDYWNNLWWMRGKQPYGAPKLAAIEQK